LLEARSGRRKTACFLLGKGFRVGERRCTLCGRQLESPRRADRQFKLGVAPGASPKAVNGRRIFLGARVLVTGVNQHLVPLLEHATNFLGDKVLAAIPPHAGRRRAPYLFCLPCGHSVLAKVRRHGGDDRYCWDWLAEMEPHGFANRWRHAVRAIDHGVQRATRSILSQLSGLGPAGWSERPSSITALEAPNHAAARADNRSS